MERRDLTGQVLDARYRVLSPVGQGAMGSVYRAEDLKLHKVVAVKVINEQVPNEMSSRRRFEREARAMAKLEHPHCASILDVGMHGDQPFVVMDFINGQSLDALVAQGPLPIARAVEITRQILFGLAHAHEHGIIHRDIKPSNIVLSQKAGMGDHVKILDFGLAKLNQESSNLTAGIIVGTPSYMAPEQIRGLVLDPRTDVYACGVLLFELLTGRKPFRSATSDPLAVCMMHLHDPPPRLADAAPGTEFGALEDVVAQALEKDRDRRFASAEAFAHALATALPAQSGPLQRPTPLPRPQTPLPRPQTPLPRPQTPAPAPAIQPRMAAEPLAATVSLAELELAPEPSATVAARPPRSTPSPRPSRPARPGAGKRWLAIGGGVAALAAAAVVIVAVTGTRDGSPSPPPAPSAADSPSPSPSAPPAPDRSSDPAAAPSPSDPPAPAGDDPVAGLLAQADAHLASGWRDGALKLLAKARKAYPQDARLPYRLGLLYFDQMYWSEALKQLRAAIKLDPSYRTDPKLIAAAVRAFSTTAGYDWTLANFLHNDIGDPAKAALEDTAKNHRNPVVRNRAAAELRRYR